ncbi:MAG: DUF1801 domain-containing protein [Candidatus Solibacter sp.]
MPKSAEAQLETFFKKYDPAIAAQGRAIRARMSELLPGAVQLVYDNYNALVIGFGPSERASEAPFSIALYPRWVTLFFLQGAGLPDPRKLLKGGGKIVRHIVLKSPEDLDLPAVRALMTAALRRAEVGIDPNVPGVLVIRSICLKQRPRRPAR